MTAGGLTVTIVAVDVVEAADDGGDTGLPAPDGAAPDAQPWSSTSEAKNTIDRRAIAIPLQRGADLDTTATVVAPAASG